MSTTIELDRSELLLWTILRSFESLALTQFEQHATAMVSPEKRALVERLTAQVPSDEFLEPTTLAAPVKKILAGSTGANQTRTLLVQGLLLEVLGQTIYQTFLENQLTSPATRDLCALGLAACQVTKRELPELLAQNIGQRGELFQAFMTSTGPVLRQLDSLGEGLDQYFSSRFGISYADLMGEFVGELIPACVELGMDRRKLVGYLTGALMGI